MILEFNKQYVCSNILYVLQIGVAENLHYNFVVYNSKKEHKFKMQVKLHNKPRDLLNPMNALLTLPFYLQSEHIYPSCALIGL